MKLLGKASSINVRKVLWTCAEIGVEVEREDWGIGFRSTDDPDFKRLNPNGLVPVLIDDRDTRDNGGAPFVLWESNTISRYLVTHAGRTDLLPTAPRERAVVEQWMDWQATELNNAWRYAFMALARNSPAHTDPLQIAGSLKNWARHLRMLDERLATTGAYAAGDAFTLADVVLGLSVNRWMQVPAPDKPMFESFDRYLALLSDRPGFKQCCPRGLA